MEECPTFEHQGKLLAERLMINRMDPGENTDLREVAPEQFPHAGSTRTVVRLSAAVLLCVATFLGSSVGNSAPNGCLGRAMTRSASICLSSRARVEGGWR